MHYVQAIISIGFFGWLGYAIAFDALPGEDGGSSKSRALMTMVDRVTGELGTNLTAALCLGLGLILAALFIRRGTA